MKEFLDLVKSSIFCDLLNLRIIWSSAELIIIITCEVCH